jgi:hypothetical protein
MDVEIGWCLATSAQVLLLAVTTIAVLANVYVGFQIWLGNIRKWYCVPLWLGKLHWPVQIDWRHVLLAFGANTIACVSVVVLPVLNFHSDWRWSATLFAIALAVGSTGALSRLRSVRNQSRRDKRVVRKA